jgi:hypothetical protein
LAEDKTSSNEATDDLASMPRQGRAFISDRQLRALLSLALAEERLAGAGVFVVLRSRTGDGYTARRLASLPAHLPILLRVTLCEGHWIAVGPPGTEPHEVFPNGMAQPWDGPVPVEALA